MEQRVSAACACADGHAAECAKGKFDGSPAYCLLSWSSANSPSPVCAYSPSPVWVCGSMQCTRYTSTRAHGHAVAAQCTMRAWSTDTHAGRPSGRPACPRPSLSLPSTQARRRRLHTHTHVSNCNLSRNQSGSIDIPLCRPCRHALKGMTCLLPLQGPAQISIEEQSQRSPSEFMHFCLNYEIEWAPFHCVLNSIIRTFFGSWSLTEPVGTGSG